MEVTFENIQGVPYFLQHNFNLKKCIFISDLFSKFYTHVHAYNVQNTIRDKNCTGTNFTDRYG